METCPDCNKKTISEHQYAKYCTSCGLILTIAKEIKPVKLKLKKIYVHEVLTTEQRDVRNAVKLFNQQKIRR